MYSAANSKLIVHPQAVKLRGQNRQLQTESVRLIVERDFLKNIAAPQIYAEYQSKIGILELRVFQFECEIRAFIRRIEMANVALNRGEKPIYQQIEQEIQTEFAAWSEKIAQQMREIKEAKALEDLPVLNDSENRELHKLYRRLALLLHPDITGAADERRQKLWLQAAEAYKNGNIATLRTIFLITREEESETPPDGDLNILENLKDRNSELKKVCEKFLHEISETKATAPYILHEILDDESKFAGVQKDLHRQIEALRAKRLQLVEHWSELMSFAADTANIQIPAEPPDIFSNDDWAEIIF